MENPETVEITKEIRKIRRTIDNEILRIIRIQASNGLPKNEISVKRWI